MMLLILVWRLQTCLQRRSRCISMPEGAFVSSVQSGSPAEDAGLQKGDIIVDFDGQSISCRSDLNSKMEYYASGEKVDITVYQGR